MKLTKYPQSCVLIEENDIRILIDPGSHFSEAGFKPESIGRIDAVLYTHQHSDHYDKAICDYFIQNDVPIYCNEATAQVIAASGVHIVADGDNFEVKNMTMQARELPHSKMVDGSDGPQNTGYVIDGIFFHPGDGYALDNLTVDNIALPVTGPDISLRDAIGFAVQVDADLVVPIHYHGIRLNPEDFGKYLAKYSEAHPEYKQPKYVVLKEGESVELKND